MQEESRKISHEQSQALQKVYEEIAINLNEVQRATICEIIEAAKAGTNTGSKTTQLNNDELDGARAVRENIEVEAKDDDNESTTGDDDESTTATGENIEVEAKDGDDENTTTGGENMEVEAKDDDNESTTGEFIEVEYSGDPSSSITEETIPAYPMISVNSEIPSNKKTSALGVLRAGLLRTRAIPFAKIRKFEKA